MRYPSQEPKEHLNYLGIRFTYAYEDFEGVCQYKGKCFCGGYVEIFYDPQSGVLNENLVLRHTSKCKVFIGIHCARCEIRDFINDNGLAEYA